MRSLTARVAGSVADGVEVILGPQDQTITNEGRRGQGHFAKVVGTDQFVFSTGADHKRAAFRMVAFADREELEVRLIYYPPYHSKYNGIERYWGGLERSWNGYLLDSVAGVLMRASQFVWRSARTTST